MKLSFLRRSVLAVCLIVAAGAGIALGAEPAGDRPTAFFNGLSRPNGKQVVRTKNQWLVITPDPTGQAPRLSTAPLSSAPNALTQWTNSPFYTQQREPYGVLRARGPAVVPPSMVVDRKGRLHIAWDDGERVWYSQADEPGGALREMQLVPQALLDDALLGDIAIDEQGEIWLAAVCRGKEGSTTLCVGRSGEPWKFEDLATDIGFHPPVMHLANDGSAHVAWSDTRGRVLYQQYRPGQTGKPHVLCTGGFYPNGRNPSIIARGEQMLVAYESLYNQIEYAVQDDGKWSSIRRLTSFDDRLTTDVLHSPQLALDRHGVVWLFFSDTTRRFTYFARWLGSQWSDAYDCRGIYYRSPRFESDLLPADWLAVEKYPPQHAHNIGLALANSLVPQQNEFHRVAVPAIKAAAGSTALFLDLLETAEMQNLDLVLNEAQKDAHNPLLKPGKPGAFDQDRVLNHGTVLFDEGKFRMWYGAAHRQRGVFWFRWMSTGYAASGDGIHWEKPCIDGTSDKDATSDKKLDCNRQPLPWPCAVFKDVHAKNSEQRYKVVQFDRHQLQLMAALDGKYDMDGPTSAGQLSQSPDGLHWTHEPVTITYPDGKPWELVVQSFFIDPDEPNPARRWKIYGYATLVARRRAGCYAYSADGRHWTAYPRNPILDPTVSEVPLAPSGPLSQIHDTVVFPYRGYYLALFHAQRDANFLDVELAASRDGEHFVHVKRGHKVITLGPSGAWDSRQILQTPAVAAHDKLWLFYGGQSMPAELLAKGETNNELLTGSAGLATLRLDGFTHLALGKRQPSGSLTTVPMQLNPNQPLSLVVNADCNSDASITVEVLDAASGKPVPGFGHGDCRPLVTDSLRSVVEFKGRDRLPLTAGKKLALQFRLTGGQDGPRLYGFGFAAAR